MSKLIAAPGGLPAHFSAYLRVAVRRPGHLLISLAPREDV